MTWDLNISLFPGTLLRSKLPIRCSQLAPKDTRSAFTTSRLQSSHAGLSSRSSHNFFCHWIRTVCGCYSVCFSWSPTSTQHNLCSISKPAMTRLQKLDWKLGLPWFAASGLSEVHVCGFLNRIRESSRLCFIILNIMCHVVFSVTMVTFRVTFTMSEWTNNVMGDGWVYLLAQTLPSLINNLWWNIIVDDWNLDAKHLVSDNGCKTVNL